MTIAYRRHKTKVKAMVCRRQQDEVLVKDKSSGRKPARYRRKYLAVEPDVTDWKLVDALEILADYDVKTSPEGGVSEGDSRYPASRAMMLS